MKTTKKGFTLIELIVVIAIIGVLAAILVPTMLGYVKKSKISAANSAASSVYKAINSALTELDEEGIDVGGDLILTYTGGTTNKWASGTTTADTLDAVKDTAFKRKVANFFADITKERNVKAAISSGSCVAVACCADSTYCGTYPAGVCTTDSYTDITPKGAVVPAKALQAAVSIAEGKKVSIDDKGVITVVACDGKYKTVYGLIK